MGRLLGFILLVAGGLYCNKSQEKTVLISILARDKAHCLPLYLKCIEELDYNKKLITIYINTNNNKDETETLLNSWAKKHESSYKKVIFEAHDVKEYKEVKPHEWTLNILNILAKIRNKSLQVAKDEKSDFYFVVDCDNFITPCTLKDLIAKDKPIIAPMLHPIPDTKDYYLNFFCAVNDWGYYKGHPDYEDIAFGKKIGTFKVPVAHCTYLIKSEYIDKLNYLDDTKQHEFVVFSRSARKNGVDQYVCNEKDFGVLLHMVKENLSYKDEKIAVDSYVKTLKTSL